METLSVINRLLVGDVTSHVMRRTLSEDQAVVAALPHSSGLDSPLCVTPQCALSCLPQSMDLWCSRVLERRVIHVMWCVHMATIPLALLSRLVSYIRLLILWFGLKHQRA